MVRFLVNFASLLSFVSQDYSAEGLYKNLLDRLCRVTRATCLSSLCTTIHKLDTKM